MTVPFWCLLLACLIPYGLAGLGAFHRGRQFGRIDNKEPRVQAAALEGPGGRAVAAQANAWEALPVFAAAVIVNHIRGGDPGTSAALSVTWVVARLLHPVFYVGNLDALRSLSFLVAFGCAIALFFV